MAKDTSQDKCKRYAMYLDAVCLEDLGEINPNWFVDLSEACKRTAREQYESRENTSSTHQERDTNENVTPRTVTRSPQCGADTCPKASRSEWGLNGVETDCALGEPHNECQQSGDAPPCPPVNTVLSPASQPQELPHAGGSFDTNDAAPGISTPAAGLVNRLYDQQTHPFEPQVSNKFATPLFCRWPEKDLDRLPAIISTDTSDDLDKMLASVSDNDCTQSQKQQSGLLGCSGDTALLTDSVNSDSEQTQWHRCPAVRGKTPSAAVWRSMTDRFRLEVSVRENYLRRSLGINLNESGTSWTSSLATPVANLDDCPTASHVDLSSNHQERFTLGAARKLFSPAGYDTDSEVAPLGCSAVQPSPQSRNVSDDEGIKAFPKITRIEDHCREDNADSHQLSDGNTTKRGSENVKHITPKQATLDDKEDRDAELLVVTDEVQSSDVNVKTVLDRSMVGLEVSQLNHRKPVAVLPKGRTRSEVDLSSVLGELLDTPPSRASLRKPAPRMRPKRQRHSLPCGRDLLKEGQIEETIPDKQRLFSSRSPESPDDHVLMGLPVDGEQWEKRQTPAGRGSVFVESNKGIMPGYPEKKEPPSDTNTHSPLSTSVREPLSTTLTKIHHQDDDETVAGSPFVVLEYEEQESEDLLFTQISPSALNAICEVIDETERGKTSSPTKRPQELETCADNDLPILAESDIDVPISDRNEITERKELLPDMTDNNSSAKSEEPVLDVFTQLSPGSIDSVIRISERVEIEQNRSSGLAGHQTCKDAGLCPGISNITGPGGGTRTKTATPGRISSKTPTTEVRSVGLRRRGKRFSYPTSKQISNVCPKKVIQFQENSLRSDASGGQNAHTLRGEVEVNPAIEDKEEGSDRVAGSKKKLTQKSKSKHSADPVKHAEKGFTSSSFCENMYLRTDRKSHTPENIVENIATSIDGRNDSLILCEDDVEDEKMELDTEKCPQITLTTESLQNSEYLKNDHGIIEQQLPAQLNHETTQNRVSNVEEGQYTSNARTSPSTIQNEHKDRSAVTDDKAPIALDDITSQDPTSDLLPRKSAAASRQNFVGFKNASGKPITTDYNKLKKYQSWFEEEFKQDAVGSVENDPVRALLKESSLEKSLNPITANGDCQTEGSQIGFPVASGKNIAVTQEVVAKYEKWFEDDFICESTLEIEKDAPPYVPKWKEDDKENRRTCAMKPFENESSKKDDFPSISNTDTNMSSSGFSFANVEKVRTAKDEKYEQWFADELKEANIRELFKSDLLEKSKASFSVPAAVEVERKELSVSVGWAKDERSAAEFIAQIQPGRHASVVDNMRCTHADRQISVKENISSKISKVEDFEGVRLECGPGNAFKEVSTLQEPKINSSKDTACKTELSGHQRHVTRREQYHVPDPILISESRAENVTDLSDKHSGKKDPTKKIMESSTDESAKIDLLQNSAETSNILDAGFLLEQRGFRTAKGKQINVNATVVAKYRDLFDEISVEDENFQHPPSPSCTFEKSRFLSGNNSTPVRNVTDASKVHPDQKNIPVGFTTGAGKAIVVDQCAVTRLSKIFEDNETTGKDIEINHNVRPVASTGNTQDLRDCAVLPKGFRPFKRPRLVEKTLNNKCISAEMRTDGNASEQPTNTPVHQPKLSASNDETEDVKGNLSSFNLNNFSHTQITEVEDCAAAFLAAEDETSFTFSQCQADPSTDISVIDTLNGEESKTSVNKTKVDGRRESSVDEQASVKDVVTENEFNDNKRAAFCMPAVSNRDIVVVSEINTSEAHASYDSCPITHAASSQTLTGPLGDVTGINTDKEVTAERVSKLDEKVTETHITFSTASGHNVTTSAASSLRQARALSAEEAFNSFSRSEGQPREADHSSPQPRLVDHDGFQPGVTASQPRSLLGSNTPPSVPFVRNVEEGGQQCLSEVQTKPDECTESHVSKIPELTVDKTPFPKSDLSNARVSAGDCPSDAKVSKNINLSPGISSEQVYTSFDERGLFQGVQGASDKRIGMSSETVQMVKELFMDILEDTGNPSSPCPKEEALADVAKEENIRGKLRSAQVSPIPPGGTPTVSSSSMMVFSTASGKDVSVAPETLSRVRNVLKETPTREGSLTERIGTPNTDAGPYVVTSELDNQVSRQVQTKVHPSKELSEGSLSTTALSSIKCTEKIKGKGGFSGFSTAKGAAVAVSEESLKKVRGLFDGCEEMADNGSGDGPHVTKDTVGRSAMTEKDVRGVSAINTNMPFVGFQTARGSKVSVSDRALAQVKDIFREENESSLQCSHGSPNDQSGDNSLAGTTSIKSLFSCFSTAKGKAVCVAEKSLNAVRGTINSINEASHPDPVQHKGSASKFKEAKAERDPKTKTGALVRRHTKEECLEDSSDCSLIQNTFTNAQESHRLTMSTPDGSRQHVSKEAAREQQMKTTPLRKIKRTTPSRKSFASTPEVFFSDRFHVIQSLTHHAVISAPEEDVKSLGEEHKDVVFRWRGPVNADSKGSSGGNALASSSILPRESNSVLATTPAGRPGQPTFTTPYKKGPEMAPASTTNVPAVTLPSFTPPWKPTASVKRSVSPTEMEFPVAKKVKPEQDTQDLVDDPGVKESEPKTGTNTSLTESSIDHISHESSEMQEDWGEEQDSLGEALIMADLEQMEQEDIASKTSSKALSPSETTSKVSSTIKKMHVPDEVLKQRLQARVAQGQRISQKRQSGDVRPQPGSCYRQRCHQRGMPLRAAVGGWSPQAYTKQQLYTFGVNTSSLTVSAASAADFRFQAADYYGDSAASTAVSAGVGDGGRVVWDENSSAGKAEFANAFLDLAGVDPKLVSREWIYNHYRWILWKLAAMEVAFPQVFGGRCLTPDRMMLQLKYRYDREVDNSQRSAIKKILERDDTPAKALVLCLSGIISVPSEHAAPVTRISPAKSDGKEQPQRKQEVAILELTDGWYPIRAVVDPALTRLVRSGRLPIGTKLYVCGAELVGSPEAAPPLEAPADTMLKLSANSCRRARWDARLGYQRRPQPPPLPINSLYADGGTVSCVDVVVVRVYPMQYMERLPEGRAVFRSERAEEKVVRVADAERQRQVECIYSRLQEDFEKRAASQYRRRSRRGGLRYSRQELAALSCGSDIHEALQAAVDPAALEADLSPHQAALLTDYRRHLQEDLHSQLQAEFRLRLEELEEKDPKRNVIPLIKVRLVGCQTKDIDTKTNTLLTIWKPSEDILELFSKGKRLLMYNIGTTESRGRGKGNAVGLTAQRTTYYKEIPVDDNFLDVVFDPREVTTFAEFVADFGPAYNEVDLVGVIIHVSAVTSFDKASGDHGHVQTIYMADMEQQLAAIKVWGGLVSLGLEEVVQPGAKVACSNLLWSGPVGGQRGGRIPTLTLTETALVSTNPREPHLRSALEQLKNSVKTVQNYHEEMKELLHSVMTREMATSIHTPQNPTSRRHLASMTMSAPIVHARPHSDLKPSPVTNPKLTAVSSTDQDIHTPLRQPPSGGGKTTTPELTAEVLKDHLDTGKSPLQCQQEAATPSPCGLPPHAGPNVRETDPAVARKRSLQRLKARRLASYADTTPVTPLHSAISERARKAFKMPTISRSASPAVGAVSRRAMSEELPATERPERRLDFEDDHTRTSTSAVDKNHLTECDTLSKAQAVPLVSEKDVDLHEHVEEQETVVSVSSPEMVDRNLRLKKKPRRPPKMQRKTSS